MRFALCVLALGVERPFLDGNITACLLVRTRWICFLRMADAGCATQKNYHRQKTKRAAGTHELSLQLVLFKSSV
jgi:hypothetical protein